MSRLEEQALWADRKLEALMALESAKARVTESFEMVEQDPANINNVINMMCMLANQLDTITTILSEQIEEDLGER